MRRRLNKLQIDARVLTLVRRSTNRLTEGQFREEMIDNRVMVKAIAGGIYFTEERRFYSGYREFYLVDCYKSILKNIRHHLRNPEKLTKQK